MVRVVLSTTKISPRDMATRAVTYALSLFRLPRGMLVVVRITTAVGVAAYSYAFESRVSREPTMT